MNDPTIRIRDAVPADVAELAAIRAREWGTEGYWVDRIGGYMRGEKGPADALAARTVIVAAAEERPVGFIAGHLTTRLGCDGELEWLNVISERRGEGIAAQLLRALAGWFAAHAAKRVCVDPDEPARAFYRKHGAGELNAHWMVWTDITRLDEGGPAR